MIEIENLHKIYDKKQRRGLSGFSLNVQPSECVGLVGPNGAGKTTLIKSLATLLSADSGTVRVAGHDVAARLLSEPFFCGNCHSHRSRMPHRFIAVGGARAAYGR